MLLNFKFMDAVESRYNKVEGVVAKIMLLLPSVMYAVVIAVSNNLYHRLATFLTEWGECFFNQYLFLSFIIDSIGSWPGKGPSLILLFVCVYVLYGLLQLEMENY